MLVNTIFESAVEHLFDVTKRFADGLEAAGIPYRVVGGLAVFVHVDLVDPMAARLTKDVDVAVDCKHLDRIRAALEPCGFTYRHAAGVDMFLDAQNPAARRAIHIEYVPASHSIRAKEGFLIAPVEDLARMKLTSFRLRDKVHIQDLDSVGLITPQIEAALSEALGERLKEVRASE